MKLFGWLKYRIQSYLANRKIRVEICSNPYPYPEGEQIPGYAKYAPGAIDLPEVQYLSKTLGDIQ